MKSVALIALLSLVSFPADEADDAALAERVRHAREERESFLWVFLDSGASRVRRTQEESARLQSEHVGNLGRLGRLGVNHLAGPLGDAGQARGIAVLSLDEPEELVPAFEPDPFVQHDSLRVRAYRWRRTRGVFGAPAADGSMGRYAIVLLRRHPELDAEEGEDAVFDIGEDLFESGKLALCGVVDGPAIHSGYELTAAQAKAEAEAPPVAGILAMRGEALDPIRALLAAQPDIEGGDVIAEVYSLYCARGVLDPKPAADGDARGDSR